MPRRLAACVALALVFPALAFALTQARIQGTIVDADGKPVEGVKATIYATDVEFEASDTTNSKGKFTLAVTDSTRNYMIRFEAEGYPPVEEPIDPVADQTLKREWTLNLPTADPEADARNQAIAVYNEGAQAYNAADYASARAKFEEAIAIDDGIAEVYLALTGVHMATEAYEEAVASADALLALDPDNQVGLAAKFDALVALERRDDALAVLEVLAEKHPGEPTAARYYNFGVGAVRADNAEEAIPLFERAIEIYPELTAPYGALASIYLTRKRYEEAVEVGERLLEIDPDNLETRTVLSEAYKGLGQPDKAVAVEMALDQVDPDEAGVAFHQQGTALFNAGNTVEAIAAFERSLAADPSIAKNYYMLGLCAVNAGDTAKAKEQFKKFLELAPDDPDAGSAREMLGFL